jgi:uncharacterized protein involved in type VI secretion and phage assembly
MSIEKGRNITLNGKYRGKVSDNHDPLKMGRITARVLLFSEERDISWATPCVPYAGENKGIFFIPPLGANVWIEFENGDIEKPIFSGCYWSENEVPDQNNDPDLKIIKTEHTTITINDKSNENRIEIKTSENQKIVVKPKMIEIVQDGCRITLESSQVSINGKNLVVKI